MKMNRRSFVGMLGVAAASLPLQRAVAGVDITESAEDWRTFQVTTRIDVQRPAGATRVWVPTPLRTPTPFQRVLGLPQVETNGVWRRVEEPATGLSLVAAEFAAGSAPSLTVRCRVQTRDWRVDRQGSDATGQRAAAELQRWLQPTRYVPVDGLVRAKADQITGGARTDEAKARALYQWILENTYRRSSARGCGTGDIRTMLETGDLGGKCADLNALFVGLARASGLPARDVYGLRVAPSRLDAKSLGVKSENATKTQHCRAEVWLGDRGWTPVDPADVRKVMLEESPGGLTLADPIVAATQGRLFGSWEMNWVALNYAQDVHLPGSSGPALPFFMYPQAETAEGRLDSLDPDAFRYQIDVHEDHAPQRG